MIKMKAGLAKSVLPDLANLMILPGWEEAEISFTPPKPLSAVEEDVEEETDD